MFAKKVIFLLVFVLGMTGMIYAQGGTIVYTFVQDGVKIDPYTGEYPDMGHVYLLEDEGYEVIPFYNAALSEAGQETLDTLNNADLIIIGRSCPSVDFQDPHKQTWNDIPTPMICLEMWALRNTRMNWLNTAEMNGNADEVEFNAIVNVPEDPVFDAIDTSDLVPWMIGPFDAIGTDDPGNGTNMAMWDFDSTLLFVRFEPDVEFYEGAGDYPAAERVVFGNGNDASGGAPFNYYNFTLESEDVFLKEVARLIAGGSAVDGEGKAAPSSFGLSQNYPNPFNPTTTIPFDLRERSHVRLSVSNVLGQEVMVLADREYGSGHHEVVLDAGQLTSGVYIYKIETENFTAMKKLAVMK